MRLAVIRSVVIGALAMVAAFAIAARAQEEARDDPTARSIEVTVTEAATGKPIEGAKVWISGARTPKVGNTDQAGQFRTRLVSLEQGSWTVTVEKDGFVPLKLDSPQRNIKLSDVPSEFTFQLEKGTRIGGKVEDEAGQPIGDADVFLLVPGENDGRPQPRILDYRVKTDASGVWHADNMPRELKDILIRLKHPDYISDDIYNSTPRPPIEKLRDLRAVMVMSKGARIAGRVSDQDGKPISGARLLLGRDYFGSHLPRATTNDQGEFEFPQARPGQSVLTVQAEGYAPDLETIEIAKGKVSEVKFKLAPGHVMRGRVVDADGHPISGAFVAADTWRGARSLQWRVDTDADGRFEWRSAPDDVVLIDSGKNGFMSVRHFQAEAGDEELSIVLRRPFTITGQVLDAETGKPVPSFQVIRGFLFAGRNLPYWERRNPASGKDGQYSFTLTEPREKVMFRFEAPGYAPASSPAFPTNEGPQTFDCRLRQAPPIEGVVVGGDGQPLANVEVVLVAAGQGMQIQDNAGSYRDLLHATTDARGRFSFAQQEEPFRLVVAADQGYAEADAAAFKAKSQLRLSPWARVEGRVQFADRSAGELVLLNSERANSQNSPAVNVYRQAKTDAEGRFLFARIPPGSYTVALGEQQSQNITLHLRAVPIEAEAGKTTTANIGGNGRPITGRILAADGSEPQGWQESFGSMVQQGAKSGGNNGDTARRQRAKSITVTIGADGRFRAEEVAAGKYTLNAKVFSPAGSLLGKVEHDFVIPEIPGGRSSEPLELAPVALTPFDDLEVGEVAPEITAVRITGEPFKLSDLRGKFVLMDFWATWCGPCIGELPNLKEVQATYNDNAKFALVSLSVDAERETVANFIEQEALGWIQVHLGEWSNSPYPDQYGVFGIPAMFLIDPEGRVVAKNLRGKAIKDEVAKVLGPTHEK